ncbi:MAG: histidine phosphatase family protein [Bacteroidales bacterium]|jgi:phosphohistidine phosphatase|nr:histidine phosphatase family protein [Bacteroidales bacterium]
MKTLYLVRHAKADKTQNDIARKLMPLGIERINKLGRHLNTTHCKIDALFSSSALRAVQTAEIIAQHIHYPKTEIITTENLYLRGQEEYFNIIVGQDNATVNNIMIVGHNPTITNIVHFFLPDFISYVQTGGCFCFDFKTDEWTTIFTAERELRFYVRFQ